MQLLPVEQAVTQIGLLLLLWANVEAAKERARSCKWKISPMHLIVQEPRSLIVQLHTLQAMNRH
jgi:hypothetical protein